MERLKIFCHRKLLLFFILSVFLSCQKDNLYSKEFSVTERKYLARSFVQGIDNYRQGSPEQHFLLIEALKSDSTFADIYREIGAPRLKRGIITESIKAYSKAVEYDALGWQGWRGYMYLYFYRDYDNAIKDFDTTDSLTPNFIDYPQSESVDFMRALCYLMKKDYGSALIYFEKYFKHESTIEDLDYVESRAFLYYGMVYYETGNFEEALVKFDLGIKHNNNADLMFWKTKTLLLLNANKKDIINSFNITIELFEEEIRNRRPYVEEFFEIYKEDFLELEKTIANKND